MSADRWPCIFKERFVREEIDPRIQEAWKAQTGKSAPFGYMRRIWRDRHCSAINPYGSESCPYAARTCGAAFMATAIEALQHDKPMGWFWTQAKIDGITRADEKPLARRNASQVEFRTDEPQGPGDREGSPDRPEEGREGDVHGASAGESAGPDHRTDLPGPGTGPQRIGELLGEINFGPHQGPFKNGSESTKR